MQIILILLVLIGFIFIRKDKKTFQNMSLTVRIGAFSFLLGIIFNVILIFLGINDNPYSESPTILYSIASTLRNLSFFVAISCLIIGIFRLFFEKDSNE